MAGWTARPSTSSNPMNASEWVAGGAAWMAGTSPAMTREGRFESQRIRSHAYIEIQPAPADVNSPASPRQRLAIAPSWPNASSTKLIWVKHCRMRRGGVAGHYRLNNPSVLPMRTDDTTFGAELGPAKRAPGDAVIHARNRLEPRYARPHRCRYET